MASLQDRLPENTSGEFFVDDTCIDCGICRWVAPASFSRSERSGLSFVRAQPDSESGTLRALMALVACPTSSIGTEHHLDAATGAAAFPEPLADGVYFCGFASPDSYGAASYFVRTSDGNVLIDSPRAPAPLLARIAALGGARWMFLTHKDDVAEHAKFRERFGCERILHRADLTSGTSEIERPIEGLDAVSLTPELTIIPVPGHTRGSMALLLRDEILFTGDHLWGDSDIADLDASRSVCWYSWPQQTRSMERLLDYRFEWVLPGHGDPLRASSAADMRARLERLVLRMKREA
jgi:glyoxylase-like metal-dependent hydrolase (beta-lactamase superfamily II)/ferredoxin